MQQKNNTSGLAGNFASRLATSLYSVNWRLWVAVMATMLLPSIYQTVRIFFLGSLPDTWGFSIASQSQYVNLFYEVIQGQSGQIIRLGGTFTNWDSSIYVMRETAPGLYELEIPLPRGTHYYAYYDGMASFVDKTNPDRAYTADGRTASVITIN